MNKDENKTLLPKLRFPEFEGKEGWSPKEVGDIFKLTRGYVLSMDFVQEYHSEKMPYPVFSSQTKNNGLAGYYSEFLYENAITWTTDGANAGDVKYRKGKFYCTNVCGVLLNNKGYANNCISELLNSIAKKHVSYVGNPKLMNGVMSKIIIPFPSIPEQQKIADCLSSLDELISAESGKLALLKDHKKGLMQQLFPAEGEKEPKLRFPEFRGSGEWEEKTFGKIASFLKGKGISKADINENGKQPCILYGELYTQYGEVIDEVFSYTNLNPLDLILSNANDVIIPSSGETKEDIATASCILRSGIALGGDINIIRTKINGIFLSYYLSNAKKNEISRVSQGFSVVHLYAVELKKLKLNIPEVEEQKRIADTLTSLDEQIIIQNQKIEELKKHKKGLMQQLFPNPDKDML